MSNKNIKNRQVLSSRNIDRRYEDNSSDEKIIVFSFLYLQKGYKLSDCQYEEMRLFASFIETRADKQWCFLRQSPKDGLGYEKIKCVLVKLPDEIKNENIISFRASKIMRIVGFRRNEVFYIVWIDPNGTVYKH